MHQIRPQVLLARPFYAGEYDFECKRLQDGRLQQPQQQPRQCHQGFKTFSGRVPSEFNDWRKQNYIMRSINRRDAYSIMKGQPAPTTTAGGVNHDNGYFPRGCNHTSGDGQHVWKEPCKTHISR